MTNTPTREHREEELRDRAEVLVDRASQGWGIAHGHYAALVRAVIQALGDAEQRGREAERAEVVAWLEKWPEFLRLSVALTHVKNGQHLAKDGE